jgi:hypothetical protein
MTIVYFANTLPSTPWKNGGEERKAAAGIGNARSSARHGHLALFGEQLPELTRRIVRMANQ